MILGLLGVLIWVHAMLEHVSAPTRVATPKKRVVVPQGTRFTFD